jgi:hypothetical protein
MSQNIASSSDPNFPIPESFRLYANRLSFSKNRVRLQALSSQTATANGQIIVRLPSNTMLNMASLTMTGSVRARIAAAVNGEGIALPTNFDYSFIESVSLISNGGIITQPFINYKLLATTLNDVYGGDEKISNRRGLQGSLPEPLLDYHDVTNDGTKPGADSLYVPFSINSWISATQSMHPHYINTNLLGDLELRITLTDNSILQTGAIADGDAVAGLQARSTYDMKDISFYIETASVQHALLDQAIEEKLSKNIPLVIPFENVFSFQQTNSGGSFNQRFSVSSQSINKIIAVTQLATDAQPTADQKKWINGIPQALRRNSNGAQQCQFSINNQYSPNYMINSNLNSAYDFSQASILTATAGTVKNFQQSSGLVETLAALDTNDYDYDTSHHKLTSTTQYPVEFCGFAPITAAGGAVNAAAYKQPPAPVLLSTSRYFTPYEYKSGIRTYLEDKYVVATSFDLACDSGRLLSGINTLGSNSQMFYNVVGDSNAGSLSTIFCLCTSTIQVYAGAQLKIIQ